MARPMTAHVPKVGLVQLGCPKNLVDSERILTQLRAEGYVIAPGYDDADVVIVNTCGFLDSAKAESLAVIEAMKMQNVLRAERDVTIKTINSKAGDSLGVDAVIMEFV